jgi:hypothetical protein
MQVVVGTKHGVYPIHAHWMDSPADCVLRWLKAGSHKAPNTGPWVYDLQGRRALPVGAHNYTTDPRT